MKKLILNDFNKNVLKLMTGSTVAQAIPIIISPLLTRLYSPEDFGVLALFIAITSILGTIANARYELAIVLPEKEEDSINLVALSIIISTSFCFLLTVTVILFNTKLVALLSNDKMGFWLYTVPLVVFFIGIFNALNYYNTRTKEFGLIANVKILKAISLATVQLLIGFIKGGVGGLIGGQIISHLFANGKLAKNLIKDKKILLKINTKKIITMAIKYKKFPLLTLWASLANSLSQHTTSIFISSIYTVSSLGHYSLVQKILGFPITLIGKSIGQVFFQRASHERISTGTANRIYKSTLKKLLLVSIPFFFLLFLLVEDIVIIVFGDEWRVAGEYAKYLIPLFFLRFLATPLTLINIIFEKQKIDLIWQLSVLILTCGVFGFAWIFNLTIHHFLILYCVIIGLDYLLIIFITYIIATKHSFT